LNREFTIQRNKEKIAEEARRQEFQRLQKEEAESRKRKEEDKKKKGR